MAEQVMCDVDRFDEIITRSFRELSVINFVCGGVVGYLLGQNNTPKTLAKAGLVLTGVAGYLAYRCPSEIFSGRCTALLCLVHGGLIWAGVYTTWKSAP